MECVDDLMRVAKKNKKTKGRFEIPMIVCVQSIMRTTHEEEVRNNITLVVMKTLF